uniref:fimbrial protein n=1 Tax=Escherichia coli TaxID=562 RepID=UPI001C405D11
MNKVTKTAIAGLLALFAGNAAATAGEIVFDGEILTSACEINDSDKKIEVALGHYNAEQFRSVGDRSPKIPFTIPLVNCPVTGWEHDNGNVEASFRLWLETRDNGTVPNFPNLAKVGSFAGTAATGVGIRID